VDKLGKLLPRVLSRQPGARQLRELRIQQAFRQLLGPELGSSFDSLKVRGATLTISTPNPALAHQLRLDSEQILARLNGFGLRTIRVRTGRATEAAVE
jgi:hypothetical protein